MDLLDLKRNDLDGAVEFYREHKAAGTLEDSDLRMLLKLQDDPDKLLAAIRELKPS